MDFDLLACYKPNRLHEVDVTTHHTRDSGESSSDFSSWHSNIVFIELGIILKSNKAILSIPGL